jgi:hypothetical protein
MLPRLWIAVCDHAVRANSFKTKPETDAAKDIDSDPDRALNAPECSASEKARDPHILTAWTGFSYALYVPSGASGGTAHVHADVPRVEANP